MGVRRVICALHVLGCVSAGTGAIAAAPAARPASPAPAAGPSTAPAAATEPGIADSAGARAATSKYERDLELARKDFETRTRQLRQEFESKAASARKTYISGLELSQIDETRKGKLEVALAIKRAIARLKSEAAAIVWPAQILPDAPVAAPVAETSKPAAPQKASATVKAGPKPVDASRGHRFDFSNEKLVCDEWNLPTDVSKWQLADGGVTIKSDRLDSRFTMHGDCSVALQYVLADYAHCWLTLCGEEIPLPEARKKVIEVLLERRGDTITLTSTLGNKSFKVKQAAQDAASPLSFRVSRDIGIRAVMVKTKELVRS